MPPLNPLVTGIEPPPIPEAHAWAARYDGAHGPALDLCQAVPGWAPHPDILAHLAQAAADPALARYGLINGDLALRETYAADLAATYGGRDPPRPDRHHRRLQPGLLPRHARPRPARRQHPPPPPLVLEPPANLHHARPGTPPPSLRAPRTPSSPTRPAPKPSSTPAREPSSSSPPTTPPAPSTRPKPSPASTTSASATTSGSSSTRPTATSSPKVRTAPTPSSPTPTGPKT